MMVRMGLNANLETIAGNQNLSQTVFELIEWAETQGRVDELIQKASDGNRGNPELRRFVERYRSTSPPPPNTEKLTEEPAPVSTASSSKPSATVSFGILHLTDLHYGLKAQESFLPGVLVDFFKDLATLHRQSGPWDLVLFSGDLVQSGKEAEYAGLQTLLDDIWQHLDGLGSHNPILLAVPGNHDLARPDAELPEVYALQDLAATSGKRGEKIWEGALNADPTNRYRAILDHSFQAYATWWKNCPYNGNNRPELSYHSGPLPGDFSAVLEKEGARLGIVGLNTTFLQLTGDDYEGKLALHLLQFNRTCENKGARWFENNVDACVLMTHQPPSWLDTTNRKEVFYAEIDTPGRFAAHFCGHMHIPDAETRGSGWSQERRLVRGGSLFGIETNPTGKTERIQAYAACRIELPPNTDTGKIRLWPRVSKPQMSGPLRFDRDTSYTLDRTKDDGGTRHQEFDRLHQPQSPPAITLPTNPL